MPTAHSGRRPLRRLLATLLATGALSLIAPTAQADVPREPPKKESGCQAIPSPSPLVPAAAAVVLMAVAAVRKR